MANIEKHTVTFKPDNVTVQVTTGENLLRAANAAGVHINASCGGEGTCGKCRIILISGDIKTELTEKLTREDFDLGYRLACRSSVESSIEIEIPPETRIDREFLKNKPDEAPTSSGRLVTPIYRESLISGWFFNPTIKKKYIEIDPPTVTDNVSDLTRTLRAMNKQHHLDNITVDFDVIKKLADTLRISNWKVTVTVVNTRHESQLGENQTRGSRKPKLINIEPGDTTNDHYIIIIDIGTTTICGQILDITHRTVLAESSDYNSQISYGEDVISRIVYSLKGNGLKILQDTVVKTINGIIDELLAETGIDRSLVSHITVAGNTTMTHLLLGLSPRYIREAPYTPTANYISPMRAKSIGINLCDHVYLYAFPLVSSFIGGDIVSGILASGFYQRDRNTLYIDIGTNGEIAYGNNEFIISASCSAGPAFEGGGIRHGMRAAPGSIEDMHILPETCEPIIHTIGHQKAKGICGSGLINIVAELLMRGILDPNGKFVSDSGSDRIRMGPDGLEYVLLWEKDGGTRDIVITEVDIDNFMRAKGAMYAGYQTLLESVGMSFEKLDEIIVAGAFGSFIDIEKAIITGLLPDIPVDKYTFIGNSSLLGAKMITFSNELLDDAERITKKITNFELSENPSFMHHYVAALFFPHTEMVNFPNVMSRFKNIENKCMIMRERSVSR